jgi:carbon starvation protein
VYALVTFLPLTFVGTTTFAAGISSIRGIFLPLLGNPATRTLGVVNVAVTSVLLTCVVLVIGGSAWRWLRLLTEPAQTKKALAS